MATGAVYQYDALGRLTNVQWDDGSEFAYQYDELGNRTATLEVASCCDEPSGAKFTIITKGSSFTASDGAGSYYRITSTAVVTLPPSPADGSVYKFKVLSGTSTFAFDGSETFNHANGVSDQNLVLTSTSGVLELIAVVDGWDET